MTEFIILLPEIILAVTFAGIIIGETGYFGEKVRLISGTALVGLASAFIQTLLTYQYGPTRIFGASLAIDGLALFFKLFFILLAALVIITSLPSKEISAGRRAEFCGLIVASVLAMSFASSAADMLLAFVALQFMNVLAYFLAAFGHRSLVSVEAAVKHLIFGSVAGALFLYGLAILFASTQSLDIHEMHRALVSSPLSPQTGLVVFILLFLAACFQFGAFPMYLSTPDVLHGAPTPVSAFLALGPRAAGFAVILRVFLVVFSEPAADEGHWQVLGAVDWPRIVALIAGATMMIGSLLAFRQSAAKRMVAFLVLAQTGFLLMGFLVLDETGIAAILYSLVVELFAIVGTFYVLSFVVSELGTDRLPDLRGLLRRATWECIFFLFFLACLVGLPPFPGFLAKTTLIGAAIRHQWYFLAAVAVASIALSTVAFARLGFSLIGDFRDYSSQPVASSRSRVVVLTGLFVPMILVGLFAEVVLHWATQSLRFILW